MARNAKLNKFNLSHGHNTSMEPGYLYPVDFVECLPGDIFKIQNEFLVRLMPLVGPMLNRMRVTLRWWYTPTRLVWDDWQNFITGGPDGRDSSVAPYVTAPSGGFSVGSLADHFRIPTGVSGLKVSALPFRVYDLVYNEWYRAESIQNPLALSKASGSDVTSNTALKKVNWRRDYFTDALPSPQKGPSIGLFGANSVAPVVGTEHPVRWIVEDSEEPGSTFQRSSSNNVVTANITADKDLRVSNEIENSGLVAKLELADGATINALRQAAAVMQFQELNMRGGNRYVEFVYNMYGVRTPDASLQRPQYVGGMSSNVVISEVLQTSETTSTSAQGTMAGHGIAAGTSPVFRFRSLEHGYLMCLMSVQPDTVYYQGVPRELQRETRFDYAIPLLSHLGEQAIYNREVFVQGTDDDKGVFGYNPRYEEYRRIPSAITGDLRSSLNYWTAARTFANLPTLNSSFLESTPSTSIWAVQNGTDHLIVQVMHHMAALRPLPKYGQPGLHIL